MCVSLCEVMFSLWPVCVYVCVRLYFPYGLSACMCVCLCEVVFVVVCARACVCVCLCEVFSVVCVRACMSVSVRLFSLWSVRC